MDSHKLSRNGEASFLGQQPTWSLPSLYKWHARGRHAGVFTHLSIHYHFRSYISRLGHHFRFRGQFLPSSSVIEATHPLSNSHSEFAELHHGHRRGVLNARKPRYVTSDRRQ